MSKPDRLALVYQEVLSASGQHGTNAELVVATGHVRHYCADAVSVEIRRWSHWAGEFVEGVSDVVLHARVYVDGDLVVDTRKLLDPELTDAQLQRLGIAEFDGLLANHPTLGRPPAAES